MQPIWIEAEQGTQDWLNARLGCLTASRAAEAFNFQKSGKESEARLKLKYEIVAEWITQAPVDRFINKAMQWGTEQEKFARQAYEEITGNKVDLCGFALHPTISYLGASPDGLVGDDGLLEIKCPQSNTFFAWCIKDEVPEEHKAQMLIGLVVTGRKYYDFCAFDPRYPEGYQTMIKTFKPTAAELTKAEEQAKQFLDEVMELGKKFTDKGVTQ